MHQPWQPSVDVDDQNVHKPGWRDVSKREWPLEALTACSEFVAVGAWRAGTRAGLLTPVSCARSLLARRGCWRHISC